MSGRSQPTNAHPFPPGYRGSGLLLHITSLPSAYGIGDLGPAAIAWIDRLEAANQSWWQSLPLGPTGYGDSPYQSLSSFAGNWLLISPDCLIEDGLLRASETAGATFPDDTVDYEAVTRFKNRLLETTQANFATRAGPGIKSAFERFRHEQAHWLDDYALFGALKVRYRGASYVEWPTELVWRSPDALAQARRHLAADIERICLAQFLVFRQAKLLKEHAHSRGVKLIGDLPFFVSSDSSDVWANPELFLLDERQRLRFVAGVPPDYFSEDGQLWGNPVYDWEALRRTGYRWYIDRVRACLAHVDLIRLDHFRGFAAAWHVPAEATTAQPGHWIPGPGGEFFRAVQRDLGTLPFIAEDLGHITADVHALRDQFELPGTRVLQFAFDGMDDNPYLPHNFASNTVVYTGTHDNNTTRGWFEKLPHEQRRTVCEYLQRPELQNDEAAAALLQLAWSSSAALALAPLQDLLNLAGDARMNVPGTIEGNWRWRTTEEMLHAAAFQWLGDLTATCNRLPETEKYDS